MKLTRPRWKRWSQVCVGGAAAQAVADRGLHPAEAFLLHAVVVVGERMTRGDSRLDVRVDERIRVTRHARRQRAVAAPIETRAALPRFLATEVRQRVGVGPT